jgi:hypothetical protein
VKRGGLWAKCMGLKQVVIENTLGEHIRNLPEPKEPRKPIGNMLGTKER